MNPRVHCKMLPSSNPTVENAINRKIIATNHVTANGVASAQSFLTFDPNGFKNAAAVTPITMYVKHSVSSDARA